MKGHIASLICRWMNASLPGKAAFLTGYLAIIVGACLTFLVQSSSVFTSTLTPLVGMGIVKVDTMYPLTLGSNIGTSFTSLLAALTAEPDSIRKAIQISLCHLFFNISGILLFYPVPLMRRVPIRMAKWMGNTTAQYRWFAAAYLLLVFFIIPAIVFALSMAGWYVLLVVCLPFIIIAIIVVIVNIMQKKCSSKLPEKFQTWDWLPLPLRSLEPYDDIIQSCCFQHECCQTHCKACTEKENKSVAEYENDILYIVPDEWTTVSDINYLTPLEMVDILEAGTPERVINIDSSSQGVSSGSVSVADTTLQSSSSRRSHSQEFNNPAFYNPTEI